MKGTFSTRLLIFLRIIFLVSIGQQSIAQEVEEFNGPFASWANVKTRFHAKGDGKHDDYQELQTAIDSLTVNNLAFNAKENAYTVLYLPKGNYKISKTLVMRGKIGVQIIGEDPEQTTITWAGEENDTMFWSNGSAYFKISRITWNANRIAGIECIGLHWKDKWNIRADKDKPATRSFASVYMELSDLHFVGNPKIGIGGGTTRGGPSSGTANNDSEVTIRRCTFNQCTFAGVRITGYNALEYWIWDSKFFQCYSGVNSLQGNYHLYRSYFSESGYCDIVNNQGYYTSARFCYSENSNAFSVDSGASSNPFKRTFQGNTIINTNYTAIQYSHVGRITLFDNTISNTKKSKFAPAVQQKSWPNTSYQILSIGNKFDRQDSSIRIANKNQKIFRKDDVVFREARTIESKPFLKKMPSCPVFVERKIFELKPGDDDRAVQAVIDQAAKLKGSRPVVHFPFGTYVFNQPVVIPAGSDVQIIGDGMRYSSTIRFAKPDVFKGNCLFKIKGPSYITIRDIQIGAPGGPKRNGIEFDAIDEPGSFVKMDQLYSVSDTTVFINRFNHTYFEKNDSYMTDGTVIIGGKKQAEGDGSLQMNCFGGQFSKLELRHNAQFVAKDCWWEGKNPKPLYLKGDGDLTIDGAKIAPHKIDSLPIVDIDQFRGKISLMNMYVQGGIKVEPKNPKLEFLYWNAHIYYQKDINSALGPDFNGRALFAGITTQCFYKDDPYCKTIKASENKSANVKDETAFFVEMTQQDRLAVPRHFDHASSGPSRIYMSRVLLENFTVALQFTP
ncbi:right-handed parallel beta-helix repeat-containing protein [Pollutibacter soli]|uniref:right-handed parallel beta-helix repeat-containing protein n=1 Tax=Pollutibacter soli TaxID=3034157 RepID=UPI00301333BA